MKYSFVKFLSLIRQISSLLLTKSSTEKVTCNGRFKGVILKNWNNEQNSRGQFYGILQPLIFWTLAPFIELRSNVSRYLNISIL